MDLIDRKAAIEAMYDFMVCGSFAFLQCGGELEEKLKSVPSVPAVPLDKLCEWLEKNATMDCDGCRATIGSCEGDDGDESVCNARERWKIMLTKWMEELDDTNRHEDA